MGLTFLAAGMSVPEAVSSVIVTNQGKLSTIYTYLSTIDNISFFNAQGRTIIQDERTCKNRIQKLYSHRNCTHIVIAFAHTKTVFANSIRVFENCIHESDYAFKLLDVTILPDRDLNPEPFAHQPTSVPIAQYCIQML